MVILLGLLVLDGTLPLRYGATRFVGRVPTWRLPVPGHAASLVTAGIEVPGTLGIEVSCQRVHCVRGSGMVKKRIRLNRKNPCTPRWFWDSMSSTSVEEVASCGFFVFHCS